VGVSVCAVTGGEEEGGSCKPEFKAVLVVVFSFYTSARVLLNSWLCELLLCLDLTSSPLCAHSPHKCVLYPPIGEGQRS